MITIRSTVGELDLLFLCWFPDLCPNYNIAAISREQCLLKMAAQSEIKQNFLCWNLAAFIFVYNPCHTHQVCPAVFQEEPQRSLKYAFLCPSGDYCAFTILFSSGLSIAIQI